MGQSLSKQNCLSWFQSQAGAAWHQFGGDKPCSASPVLSLISPLLSRGAFLRIPFCQARCRHNSRNRVIPQKLQHVTQSLLVPAHVSRGDAPGSIPPLHRLPGPCGIPGHQEWAGTHCSPFSLSGGPPKALTSLCSRFC